MQQILNYYDLLSVKELHLHFHFQLQLHFQKFHSPYSERDEGRGGGGGRRGGEETMSQYLQVMLTLILKIVSATFLLVCFFTSNRERL